jgi:DNA-binding transcriptional MerR regulator
MELRSMEGFTALQASRFTGSTGNQLRYWDKIGLVKPTVQATGGRPGVRRVYSFRDLIALKVVKSLLDGGMSLQRVRRAYSYLRENADLEEHLSTVKLVTDGKSIFKICRDEGEILDALRQGQMAFFVAIDRIAGEVGSGVSEFIRDREQFVRTLRAVEHGLELETAPKGRRERRRSMV